MLFRYSLVCIPNFDNLFVLFASGISSFNFVSPTKWESICKKKPPNLVEIALGKQKHLQELPKEVIATVQNFGQKKKL